MLILIFYVTNIYLGFIFWVTYCSREERKWRKWVDDEFVHTLSPNVYRTLDEAYKTFNWFSEVSSLITVKHHNILYNQAR